jgi:hypothetical protein
MAMDGPFDETNGASAKAAVREATSVDPEDNGRRGDGIFRERSSLRLQLDLEVCRLQKTGASRASILWICYHLKSCSDHRLTGTLSNLLELSWIGKK